MTKLGMLLLSTSMFTTFVSAQERVGCIDTNIDFDFSAKGNAIASGALISDQYADLGISFQVSSNGVEHNAGITFDSQNPTGEDFDLGLNDFSPEGLPYSNLLIIAEDMDDFDLDGLVDDPDDNAKGGSITMSLAYPTVLEHFDLIDFDSAGSTLSVLGEEDFTMNLAVSEDGGVQRLTFSESFFADQITINLVDSGAVDNFKVCVYKPLFP